MPRASRSVRAAAPPPAWPAVGRGRGRSAEPPTAQPVPATTSRLPAPVAASCHAGARAVGRSRTGGATPAGRPCPTSATTWSSTISPALGCVSDRGIVHHRQRGRRLGGRPGRRRVACVVADGVSTAKGSQAASAAAVEATCAALVAAGRGPTSRSWTDVLRSARTAAAAAAAASSERRALARRRRAPGSPPSPTATRSGEPGSATRASTSSATTVGAGRSASTTRGPRRRSPPGSTHDDGDGRPPGPHDHRLAGRRRPRAPRRHRRTPPSTDRDGSSCAPTGCGTTATTPTSSAG